MTLRTVTFKLEEEVLVRIDKLAKKRGISRTDLLREMIRFYFETKSIVDTRVTRVKFYPYMNRKKKPTTTVDHNPVIIGYYMHGIDPSR